MKYKIGDCFLKPGHYIVTIINYSPIKEYPYKNEWAFWSNYELDSMIKIPEVFKILWS